MTGASIPPVIGAFVETTGLWPQPSHLDNSKKF
jgi:hypothetical protein